MVNGKINSSNVGVGDGVRVSVGMGDGVTVSKATLGGGTVWVEEIPAG